MEKIIRKDGTRSRVYICYTLVFLLLSFCMLLQFFLYSKTLLITDDGYMQWYAELVKMKSVVSDFFHGKGFSFWSWDTGLGGDWIGHYATVFCDPFNYIALLFSKEKIDIAYVVICFVKMYVAGLGMLAFLRYHNRSQIFCLLGAVGYVFCAWSLYGVWHIFFITQLAVFPLLILGVDKIEDKKSPLTLILGVAASLVISLYYSWMSALFVCIYIVMKYFTERVEKTFRSFLLMFIKYILYVFIGVLISAPILFSALYTLIHASTGSGADAQYLPNMKDLFSYIPAYLGNFDYAIGTNPFFVIMVPAIILTWKEKKTSVKMFFICVLISLLPILMSVLNGFSYPTKRWCYVFVFFFAYAAVDCFHCDILRTKKYQTGLRIWLGLLVVGCVLAYCMRAVSAPSLISVFVNLIFCFVFYLLLTGRELSMQKKRWYMAGLTLLSMGLVLFITFSPATGTLYHFMTAGRAYELYDSCGIKQAKGIEDNDFYRVDTVEKPNYTGANAPYGAPQANTAIFYEVPSTAMYMSTLDKNWTVFNQLLDNNSGCTYRNYVRSNDNRSRMDFLLGVKYFLGDNRKKGWKMSQYAGYAFAPMTYRKGVQILKSKYNAALGYVYSDMISETDFLKYTALKREQILMQSVLVSKEDKETITGVNTVNEETLQLDDSIVPSRILGSADVEVSDGELLVKGANGRSGIELGQEITNSEVYVVFHNLKRKGVTADEQWAIREQRTEEFWKQEKRMLFDTSKLAKADFYANYMSKVPYGNFNIAIEKGEVQKNLINGEGMNWAIRDVEDYMINLGYMEKCSGTISCYFKDTGRYTFDSIEVIAVPQNNFDVQAGKLERNRLTVTEYGDNRVVGEVNAEQSGLLYMSILYHDGWSIYVDGKKVDKDKVYRVNTAFTGVEMPAGKHKVELIYRPVGFRLSIILFLTGLLAIFAIAVYDIIRHRKRTEVERTQRDE